MITLDEACKAAVHFMDIAYISSILKVQKGWLFSFCDEEGHGFFISPILVSCEDGDIVYSYGDVSEDAPSQITEETVPIQYMSKKQMIIDKVMAYNDEKQRDIAALMDCAYEQYNLYETSVADAFAVLNFFLNVVINGPADLSPDEVVRYLSNDYRPIHKMIEESAEFRYEPESIKKLINVRKQVLECAMQKHLGILEEQCGISESEIRDLLEQSKKDIAENEYCEPKLLSMKIQSVEDNVYKELDYINDVSDEVSDALNDRIRDYNSFVKEQGLPSDVDSFISSLPKTEEGWEELLGSDEWEEIRHTEKWKGFFEYISNYSKADNTSNQAEEEQPQ